MKDLAERLFIFAVRTLKFLGMLGKSPESRTIRYQLAKAATSSGANYEEAQAGSSRADFMNKIRISLREMRESNYWLRIIQATYPEFENDEELFWLIQESKELKNILGSIANKTRSKV
jgi:four helix bundle protein